MSKAKEPFDDKVIKRARLAELKNILLIPSLNTAQMDIQTGAEITIDYQRNAEDMVCLCESDNCRNPPRPGDTGDPHHPRIVFLLFCCKLLF